MEAIKILTLVGGISRNSLNQRFFRAIKSLHLDKFEFVEFDISKLPYFSQDIEMDPPDSVTEYKEKIRETQALLLISPEYNRSFPGVLKNAIDWGSRPYGQNLWDKKPAALLGASPGNIGTFGAQHHLRQVLSYLNMYVLGQPEFYFKAANYLNEVGKFSDEKTKELLYHYFEEFYQLINLVSTYSSRREEKSMKSQGLEDSPLVH